METGESSVEAWKESGAEAREESVAETEEPGRL